MRPNFKLELDTDEKTCTISMQVKAVGYAKHPLSFNPLLDNFNKSVKSFNKWLYHELRGICFTLRNASVVIF